MSCTFAEFAEQVRCAKLSPKDCGNNHWRILGGASCVNFYPSTKRGPRMYVDGSRAGSHRSVTVADAIAAASTPPAKKNKGTKRRQLQESREQDARSDETRKGDTMSDEPVVTEFKRLLGKVQDLAAADERERMLASVATMFDAGREQSRHALFVSIRNAIACSEPEPPPPAEEPMTIARLMDWFNGTGCGELELSQVERKLIELVKAQARRDAETCEAVGAGNSNHPWKGGCNECSSTIRRKAGLQ